MLSLISLVLFIAVLSSTHAIHEGRLLSQHRALGRRASHQLHDLARPVEPIKRVPQQRCRSRPSQKSSPPVADIGTDNPGKPEPAYTISMITAPVAPRSRVDPVPESKLHPKPRFTPMAKPPPSPTPSHDSPTIPQPKPEEPAPQPKRTAEEPVPAPKPLHPAGGPSYMQGTNTGDATYYDTGLTACGRTYDNTDLIVAVSKEVFDTYPGYRGGNPNMNPICGQLIDAAYDGKTVRVAVEDRCIGCAIGDLDFTSAGFDKIAQRDVGRIHGVKWTWVG